MAESSFTTADFHNVVQKHILNALYEQLGAGKMDWQLILPFLEAAREFCRSEFREGGSVRLHTLRADGEQWVDAEEAFLGISVADRDDGQEWLSETYWISDVALVDQDPEQVRRIVAALGRSIAKLNTWLVEQEKGGPDEPE